MGKEYEKVKTENMKIQETWNTMIKSTLLNT